MTGLPFSLSVKAVVRRPDGRCLLLRRSPGSHNHPEFWEFPGGKLDPGERPDEALTREIREETGLEAVITRVAGAGESEMPERRVAYLFFEAAAPDTRVRLSSEHDAFEWVAPGQLCEFNLCPQFRVFAKDYSSRTPALPD